MREAERAHFDASISRVGDLIAEMDATLDAIASELNPDAALQNRAALQSLAGDLIAGMQRWMRRTREIMPLPDAAHAAASMTGTPAAPAPVASNQVAPPSMAGVAPSAPLGVVDVVVGPFARFGHLGHLIQAIRLVPGVSAVDLREFTQGVANLRVRYTGSEPLEDRIGRIGECQLRLVAKAPGRIELLVFTDTAPSSEEPLQEAPSSVI